MLLSLLSIAWLAGIALGSKLDLSFTAFFLSLPLVTLSFSRKFRRKGATAAACVLMLVGGALVSDASGENAPAGSISTYNGQNVVISGMVTSDPDVRDENVRLRVSVLEVDINGASWQSTGDLLVYADKYPSFEYGDVLQISGKLNVPVAFDEFDYAGYLARQDIYSVMFDPAIEREDSGQGNPVLDGIFDIRHRLADSLARVLPEPQASIAQGILLGLRSNISTEVNDTFIKAGTAHLLAISGLNLTLISGLLVSALVFLMGRRHYIYVWVVAAAIWLYVILCGASPSVVRAAIMSSIFLVSELAGRQKRGGPALLFTAAIMVGINPNLLSDISFQLSFLSMCGLVYVYPVLREFTKRLESRLPERFSSVIVSPVLDSLAISTSAVIAIWPALAINFGAIATAGPLATLIITPTLPVIMAFSFAASVFGIIYPVIGQAIGTVAWLFISFMLLVNRLFALWPTIGIKELNAYIVAGYYSVLLISVRIFIRFKRKSLFIENRL